MARLRSVVASLLIVGGMPAERRALEAAQDGGSRKEWTGVRKREFDRVDDVSTSPITSDEFANRVKLSSSSLKPGGGANGVVTGGDLRSIGGAGYGMLFLVERVMRRPWRIKSCQTAAVMCI